VHRYLARTPSPLLGVALDDVTAEVEPANVPGITPDRYPSWTRRQRIPLEHIAHDPHALAVLGAVRERAPDPLADT
jgi:4-alpha-glucanotransferase